MNALCRAVRRVPARFRLLSTEAKIADLGHTLPLQCTHPPWHTLFVIPAVPQLPMPSTPEREHLAIAGEHCRVNTTNNQLHHTLPC